MKKKLIFLLFCYIFFISNIKALQETMTLNEPVIEIKQIKGFGLQGFTTFNDYLFVVLNGVNDTEAIIRVYDLRNNKMIYSKKIDSIGHANDVTYNKNTNKIYVLHADGKNTVYVFDGTSFALEEVIQLDLPARSITYLEDINKYAIRLVTSGFILNEDLTLFRTTPFVLGMNLNDDIARQGWSYYQGNIYYATWSWVSRGGDGTNTIYVYDLGGKLVDKIYTDDTIGEIQDIAFYNDKMVLGFNGYDTTIKFYLEDIPKIEKFENDEIILEEENNKSNNYVFIIVSMILVILISLGMIIVFNKKRNK